MTGLRELMSDVAAEPAPPSRLTADDLFTAGRVRRRRRRGALAGALAAVLAGVVVTGALVQAAAPQSQQRPATESPPPVPEATGPVQWAAAADANHLYLAYLACPTAERCAKTAFQVAASADGGRSWGRLGGRVPIGTLVVLGPGELASLRPDAAWVTVDGGATWRAAQAGAAVPAVPAASDVVCLDREGNPACRLSVIDAGAARIAALAHQPPLDETAQAPASVVRAGDRLWVPGLRDGRPVVAESADAGRTWSVRVLAGCTAGCSPPELLTGPGGSVYAVSGAAKGTRSAAYQWLQPGKWVGLGSIVSAPRWPSGSGFVTADGRLVLVQPVRSGGAQRSGADVDRQRYWVYAAGRFTVASPPGLPDTVYPVRRSPDGFYSALSYADQTLHVSTDGWRWSPAGSR